MPLYYHIHLAYTLKHGVGSGVVACRSELDGARSGVVVHNRHQHLRLVQAVVSSGSSSSQEGRRGRRRRAMVVVEGGGPRAGRCSCCCVGRGRQQTYRERLVFLPRSDDRQDGDVDSALALPSFELYHTVDSDHLTLRLPAAAAA
eukprot:CAMPEP_0175157828 /NCGR_PEP_ID=MMETSP0087-20121206/22451_1 /TAXON_ID=136419 /ORGANISM="Unknown Unknown, Strain D1" /LENGTH=144 /DNA_ID=CAMNT_0016445545 /DNA_START=339 /DNA_END=770 /DNA_ORIENTATION=+